MAQAAQAPHRDGFRPDVEGLRAVAILAVVAFHAALPGATGGFVGVDMFYVISGFLITGLLWRELDGTGRIGLAQFYARRARRILPAAMLVLVVTLIASVYWLPPLRAKLVTTDALDAALYVANYRFAAQGTDYLSSTQPPSPIQHYWSLGVEEQFYLIWPILLLMLALFARRRLVPVALFLIAIALGSFIWSLNWTRTLPAWAFFSLPTRAWELAIGGIIALAVPWLRKIPPALATPLGWAGLATAIGSCIFLNNSTAFPGTAALYPVLGTAVVIAAGTSGARVGAHVLLARPPFRAIGRVSYSWYLWHWPVLLLAPVIVGSALNLPGRLLAAVISLALAAATLVLVENPIRFAKRLRVSPRRGLLMATALTSITALAALIAATSLPSLTGPGAATAPIRLAQPGLAEPNVVIPAAHHRIAEPLTPVQREIALLQPALAEALLTKDVPSNLQPSLMGAAIDKAEPFFDGCLTSWTDPEPPNCFFGDTSAHTTVMLLGDSHAAQWFPAFDLIAKQHHWQLQTLGKAACPPLDMPVFSPYLGREYTECAQWLRQSLTEARTEKPKLIVLGVARHYNDLYHFTVYSTPWLAGLSRSVREFRATGARVLVLGAIPKPPTDVPTCLSANLTSVRSCNLSRGATLNSQGIAFERMAVQRSGGTYFDVSGLFCGPTRCPVIVGNDLVYRDDNHLTTYYAEFLEPILDAEVHAVMQLPG